MVASYPQGSRFLFFLEISGELSSSHHGMARVRTLEQIPPTGGFPGAVCRLTVVREDAEEVAALRQKRTLGGGAGSGLSATV